MRRLTDTEWILLKALWGKEPQTLRSIIQTIREEQPEVDWNYKTYHAFLRTMCEKGLVVCQEKNARDNYYTPGVTREEAMRSESQSLVSRISSGSVGELIALMAQSGELTEQDEKELMDLTRRLDSENRKRGE